MPIIHEWNSKYKEGETTKYSSLIALQYYQWLIKEDALGSICVPAHPFRRYESMGDYVMRIDGFDAIETHNGSNLEKANKKAIQVAQLKGLPSIGGSDCHERMQVGRAFTVFEKSVYTMEDLVREIKAGNYLGSLRKEN